MQSNRVIMKFVPTAIGHGFTTGFALYCLWWLGITGANPFLLFALFALVIVRALVSGYFLVRHSPKRRVVMLIALLVAAITCAGSISLKIKKMNTLDNEIRHYYGN